MFGGLSARIARTESAVRVGPVGALVFNLRFRLATHLGILPPGLFPSFVICSARRTSLRQMTHPAPWSLA